MSRDQQSTQSSTSELLDRLMKAALGKGDSALSARSRVRELLSLDELNFSYFFNLYRSWAERGKGPARVFRIYQPGDDLNSGSFVVPTSVAPPEMSRHLSMVEYTELKSSSERYDEAAREVALWVKKMQAGSGSSIERRRYLSQKLGVPAKEVRIGAKGTDLYMDSPDIPIAEAQLLQCIRAQERGEIGEMIFHDLVSSETQDALARLWAKPCLQDSQKTYADLVRETPGVTRSGETFQSFVPTLDESGRVTLNRKAPAGHALFAVEALRAAYTENHRPRTGKKLIAAISNGEDLSSSPDRFMLGYMVKHQVPIVLVITEKTPVDAKGGLIS